MTKLLIIGHGGYGTAMQNTVSMLTGEVEGVLFIDFTKEDDLQTLIAKLNDAVAACGEEPILFACDVTGGSPFRQCAMLCVEHPEYVAVAGLNVAAYCEMVYNLELPPEELCTMGMEVAHGTIQRFPEKKAAE